jgi:uncharacterized membrane protein required for colicin V production
MNRFDIILLVVVFLYALRGFFRGGWSELFNTCLFLGSLTLTILFVERLAAGLTPIFHISRSLCVLIGFFVLYGVISIVLRLAFRFLHEHNKPSLFQRVSGLGIGLFRGIFAAGIFAFLITNFITIQRKHGEREKSLLVKPLGAIAPAAYHALVVTVPDSRQVFDQMKEGFVYCSDRFLNNADTDSLKD